MATDDRQRLVLGAEAAPASFVVPGNGQVRPKAIYAAFDGSSAAGAFKPALKITSDAGELVGIYPTDDEVAAGASADVSWAPFLGRGSGAGTGAAVISAYARRFGAFDFAVGQHVFLFGGGTMHTNDPSVFSIDLGLDRIAAAHGGLFMTTVFMSFSTTDGTPFSGQFQLTTDVLDSANASVEGLTQPEIDYPELYATNGGNFWEINGFGLVNGDDTFYAPPYNFAYVVETDTAITATACSYGVTILNPTGLT